MKALLLIVLALFSLGVAPPRPVSYPMLGGSIANGGEEIKLSSTVVRKGDQYEYTYVLRNLGKKTWLVGSSVPDRCIGLSSDRLDVAHYYKLKGGETAKIVVLHKDAPVEYLGVLKYYNKDKFNGIREWYKEHQVTMFGVKPTYYFQMSGSATGWIPKRYREAE